MAPLRLTAVAAGFAALLAGQAVAAETMIAPNPGDHALFTRQPGLRPNVISKLATANWTFTYSRSGTTYNDVFIGNNPASGGSATVPIYIIPIKMVYGSTSFSPLSTLPNGQTVIQNVVASPIFQSSVDFVQGGTNVGATQFTDAFQKVNVWGIGGSASGYHVLLGNPVIEPEQTLTVPKSYGLVTTAFNTNVIEASINWFDPKLQALVTSLHIPANALPIFVTTQTYLLQNNRSGCCIGGYHSYTGTQAYSHFTYIQTAGAFAQDVSALSHELAEWLDDPTTNNNSPCGIYEVGDPLEGTANYGDYAYTTNGFTYHLQDEATPVYFGAPASTTLGGYTTFEGTKLGVCANGS